MPKAKSAIKIPRTTNVRQKRSTLVPNPVKLSSSNTGAIIASATTPMPSTFPEFKRPRATFVTASPNGLKKTIKIPGQALHLPVPQRKTTAGEVFVVGNGDCGQLGVGPDTFEAVKPKKVPIEGVVEIAAGGLHNLALTLDGKVYSWGCNDQRALGRDGEETEPHLVQNLENVDVVKVAAGDCWSAALDKDGKVYTWGTFRNETGIFGYLPGIKIQHVPALFEPLAHMKIVDIAGGSDHIIALANFGEVFTWGNGRQHQLGRKVVSRREELTSLLPAPLGLKKIVKVNAGAYHSFAIDSDGDAFVWGLNNFGQCAVNAPVDYPIQPTYLRLPTGTQLKDITGGEHHSIALTQDGHVYTWGRSDSYQLGLGYTKISPLGEPIRETEGSSSSNFSSGSKSLINIPQVNPFLQRIESISANSHQCIATDATHHAFAWGYGEAYQLGNRQSKDEEVPAKIQTGEGTQILGTTCGSQHTLLLALRNKN